MRSYHPRTSALIKFLHFLNKFRLRLVRRSFFKSMCFEMHGLEHEVRAAVGMVMELDLIKVWLPSISPVIGF